MALGKSSIVRDGSSRVERINDRDQLEDFARFPYQLNAGRDAWWPPDVQNEIDFVSRRTPASAYLDLAAFCARREDQILARVTAVVNRRYNEHWNERLGHLIHFEALEGEDDATVAMIEGAVEWQK